MGSPQIDVVKVGGSLLDLPDLGPRLRSFLRMRASSADFSATHHVLLVGGGSLADQVRRWHALQSLDPLAAHWMCIDAMAITAQLVHARLPEVALVDDSQHLRARVEEPGTTLWNPATWLRLTEPHLPGLRLDATWDVTSDAIAGRLAVVLGAVRLTILKSAPPSVASVVGPKYLSQLAASGYIDRALPAMADALPPIEFIDFRASDVPCRP